MNPSIVWLLIIILVVVALLGAPTFGPVRHSFGYIPSGTATLILIILVVLLLTGRL